MNNQISLSPNQIKASGKSANTLANWVGASIFVLSVAGAVKMNNNRKKLK